MIRKDRSLVGAVVAAAGRSTRMGGADKLFAPLGGRPVLEHTLRALQATPEIHHIVLVVAEPNVERARALVTAGAFDKVKAVCPGGERRQDSVAVGLGVLAPCDWVVVHDGARPFVTRELIVAGLAAARRSGAATAGLHLADTVKQADADHMVLATLDRDQLWAVQTPQVFRYDLLLEAHRACRHPVPDDAAAVEALGTPVHIYPGSHRNLKITTPEDLALAEALLRLSSEGAR